MNDQQKSAPAKPSNEDRALAVIDDGLKAYEPEFARLLGQSVNPQVFTAVAYEAFRHNRDLLNVALTSPDSIMKALHDAAALKLVPNGVLGSAYIVPRRNKTTGRTEAYFQIGYRGLTELARRSGQVKSVEARIVYENDTFELHYGTTPRVVHVPTLDGPDRGKVRGAYGIGFMKDGTTIVEYMTVDQINAIRERSPSKSGPWSTDYEEMVRKTVVRRLCKYLPLSVEVQRAIELDDAAEGGTDTIVVEPVAPTDQSLAGRIRNMTGTATTEVAADAPADEPKDVTPKEPAAKAEPKKTTRKKAPAKKAPEAAETGQDAPDEPEPSNDTPDDEAPADGAPDEPTESEQRVFGERAKSHQDWHGMLEPQKNGAKLHTDSWKAKVIGGNDECSAFIDSIAGSDERWHVGIAGTLELVPWEREGKPMPPYRQITAHAIEVRGRADGA